MTVLMLLARAAGLTEMNGEMMLGSMVTSSMNQATWFLGFAIHMAISVLIALAYAGGMELFGRSGWDIGLGLAVVHTVLAGFFLLTIPAFHPLVQSGDMMEPGAFAANLGAIGVVVFILEHLMYGAIVGQTYELRRRPVAIAG